MALACRSTKTSTGRPRQPVRPAFWFHRGRFSLLFFFCAAGSDDNEGLVSTSGGEEVIGIAAHGRLRVSRVFAFSRVLSFRS